MVPEDDDQVIGNFATTPEAGALIADADVLLSVGTHFRSNETKHYSMTLPSTHIQLDIDPAAIGRVYPADVGLEGDSRILLEEIVGKLSAPSVEAGWTA
ncbi:acetolactate synthase isozyme 3 large subunit, partial [Arthrobacter sp. Hiyo6]